MDPKYIDPVPVTQKVIEGGGMGFFRRKNGEVGVLVRFDDAHWREKIAMIFCFGIANGRVYNPHAANTNQHGDRIFFCGEGREREIHS